MHKFNDNFAPVMLGLASGVTVADIDLIFRVLTFFVVGVPTGVYYANKFWRERK